MGKIKKILENELIGGTQSTEVYPVTSTKAVYDENNKSLDTKLLELEDISKFSFEKGVGMFFSKTAFTEKLIYLNEGSPLSSSTMLSTKIQKLNYPINNVLQISNVNYGDFFNVFSCWKEDPEVSGYTGDNHVSYIQVSPNTEGFFKTVVNKTFKYFCITLPIQVIDDSLFVSYGDKFLDIEQSNQDLKDELGSLLERNNLIMDPLVGSGVSNNIITTAGQNNQTTYRVRVSNGRTYYFYEDDNGNAKEISLGYLTTDKIGYLNANSTINYGKDKLVTISSDSEYYLYISSSSSKKIMVSSKEQSLYYNPNNNTYNDVENLKKGVTNIEEELKSKTDYITKQYSSNIVNITGNIRAALLTGVDNKQINIQSKNICYVDDGTNTQYGINITTKDNIIELEGVLTESQRLNVPLKYLVTNFDSNKDYVYSIFIEEFIGRATPISFFSYGTTIAGFMPTYGQNSVVAKGAKAATLTIMNALPVGTYLKIRLRVQVEIGNTPTSWSAPNMAINKKLLTINGDYYISSKDISIYSEDDSTINTTLYLVNDNIESTNNLYPINSIYSLSDKDKNSLLNIDSEGYFSFNNYLLNSLATKSNAENDLVINTWGDSLTMGQYQDELMRLLDYKYWVRQGGVGGEGVFTICARIGAIPMRTASEFTIPADTSEISIGTIANSLVAYWNNEYKPVKPFLQDEAEQTINPVIIDGIKCQLRAQTYAGDSQTVYLSRLEPGEEWVVPAHTLVVTNSLHNYRNCAMSIINIGQNGGQTDNDDLFNMIKAIVDTQKSKEYLCIGYFAGNKETLQGVSQYFQQKIGARFIDFYEYATTIVMKDGQKTSRALIDAGITPDETDLSNLDNGQVPMSLKRDGTHLNNIGNRVLAKLIHRRIIDLGMLNYR